MAPTLSIYVDYHSQPCRFVGILCRTVNAPYEEHQVSLMKKEHKAQEFLNINPFGKIPSIKDGNLIINESCTAMRYIATKYDKTGQWYPQDLVVRTKVDEYLDWQHTNTRKHGVAYFCNKLYYPYIYKKPVDWEVVNEHKEALVRIEKEFVSYFLSSKPFIAGDCVTIADLVAACELEQPQAAGYDFSQPIKEYLQRVKAELGSVYDEIHKALYDSVKP